MWTFCVTFICLILKVKSSEDGLAYLPGTHNPQYINKFQRAFESIGTALSNQGSKDVDLKLSEELYPRQESQNDNNQPQENNRRGFDSTDDQDGSHQSNQEKDFWSQLFVKHDSQRKKIEPTGNPQQTAFDLSKIFDKHNERDDNSKVHQVFKKQELENPTIEIPVGTTPTALFVMKASSLTAANKEWTVDEKNDRKLYSEGSDEETQEYDRENGRDNGSDKPQITDYFPQQPILSKPKIKSIEAKCSKEAMSVRVTYDKPFDGIIYAKDYYSDQSCHFVEHRSGQIVFEFSLELNRCGTTLIDEFDSNGETVLENTLIFQNELTFQEIWDSVRQLRCAWSGVFDKTVQTSINVGLLDSQTITYRGDSVESVMDVHYGHGLNAGPVQGLVRIGDDLTVSVSLIGSDANNFDVRVKDCIAHDGDVRNAVQLTDQNGCVLKKKLLGQWQKHRNLEDSTVTTFSYIQAFRFPEKMEVYFECNIEICKYECRDFCTQTDDILIRSQSNRNDEEIKLRSKRNTNLTNEDRVEPIRLLRGIRVVVPNGIDFIEPRNLSSISKDELMLENNNSVCVAISNFVITLFIVFLVLIILCLLSVIQCLKFFNQKQINQKSTHLSKFYK